MEEESLKEPWTWLDEVLKLDSEAAFPSSVWDDDFSQSEAVVRNLFLAPPPAPHLKESTKSDLTQNSSSWEIMPDCNPSPFKRRRVIQYNRDDIIDMSSLLSEHHEDCTHSSIDECTDFQAIDIPSTTWLMSTEESFSSIEDTLEHSTGSRCISESETSEVQELFHNSICHPLKVSASKSLPTAVKGERLKRNSKSISSTISTNKTNTPGSVSIEGLEPGQAQTIKESCNPVLAYPFALLKPSAIQGDLTLHDINKRINRESMTLGTPSKECRNASPSPLSGKSVLALTKIYTEGKGTITIMKTRGETKQGTVISL